MRLNGEHNHNSSKALLLLSSQSTVALLVSSIQRSNLYLEGQVTLLSRVVAPKAVPLHRGKCMAAGAIPTAQSSPIISQVHAPASIDEPRFSRSSISCSFASLYNRSLQGLGQHCCVHRTRAGDQLCSAPSSRICASAVSASGGHHHHPTTNTTTTPSYCDYCSFIHPSAPSDTNI